jgi:hypothetical protein
VHFPACYRHALFTIQRSVTRIRIEELNEAVGLFYGNLGKLAISVESFKEVALVDFLCRKIA